MSYIRRNNLKQFPDPIATHGKGNPERFNRFVEINGIEFWSTVSCTVPFCDHDRIYYKKDGEQVYVSHPYVYASEQTFQMIHDQCMEWAKNRDLVCDVYPPERGWYCLPDKKGPGAACVIIHKPDVEVLMPE